MEMRVICTGVFLSTLSLRRATCVAAVVVIIIPTISIHALLAESDSSRIIISVFGLISIHALLAESDTNLLILEPSAKIFLSTLSLRRATT